MPTHGSLTKAGKMRHVLKQQPVWREIHKQDLKGTRRFHGKPSKIPRVRNRRRYEKQYCKKKYF